MTVENSSPLRSTIGSKYDFWFGHLSDACLSTNKFPTFGTNKGYLILKTKLNIKRKKIQNLTSFPLVWLSDCILSSQCLLLCSFFFPGWERRHKPILRHFKYKWGWGKHWKPQQMLRQLIAWNYIKLATEFKISIQKYVYITHDASWPVWLAIQC